MKLFLTSIACLIALVSPLLGQQPASVAELRRQYDISTALAQAEIDRQEVAALKALEKVRVAAGDFEGAQRVGKRLEELSRFAAPATDGRKTISLTSKSYFKKVGFGSAISGNGIFLKKTSSDVSWEVPSLAPGHYRAKLTYGSPSALNSLGEVMKRLRRGSSEQYEEVRFGGKVSFALVSTISGSRLPAVDIAGGEGWNVPKEITLGEFEIKSKTTGQFLLKAEYAENGGLLYLFKVDLIPIAPPPAAEPAEFALKRQKYTTETRTKTLSTHQKWMAALTKLQQEYVTAGDTSAAQVVLAEIERVAPLAGGIVKNGGQGTETPAPGIAKEIELSATEATSVSYIGEIRPTNNKDALSRLRPAGSRISFKLKGKVQPGDYKVSVEWRSVANSGGDFSVRCKDQKVTGTMIAHSSFDLFGDGGAPAGGWLRAGTTGTLSIPADATYLEFYIDTLVNPEGVLCDLRSIKLKPAAQAAREEAERIAREQANQGAPGNDIDEFLRRFRPEGRGKRPNPDEPNPKPDADKMEDKP